MFLIQKGNNLPIMPIKKKIEPRRIMGIDPGTNFCGYAVIEIVGSKISLLEMGVFHMKHLETHYDKLRKIFLDVQEVIEIYEPTSISIEAPFYGKNIQSMLKLGRAQGVAMAAAMTMGLDVTEYAPKKIKQSVTGNGNASKEQVAAMLKSIVISNKEDASLDATDALGAAVCHHYQSSGPLGGNGKKYKDWSSFLTDNPSRKGKL